MFPHYIRNAGEIRMGGVAAARGDGEKEDSSLYGMVLRGLMEVFKIMTGKDLKVGVMVIDQNTKLPKAVRLMLPMFPGLTDTIVALDWPHCSRTLQEKQRHRFKNYAVFHGIANGHLHLLHMCKSNALCHGNIVATSRQVLVRDHVLSVCARTLGFRTMAHRSTGVHLARMTWRTG